MQDGGRPHTKRWMRPLLPRWTFEHWSRLAGAGQSVMSATAAVRRSHQTGPCWQQAVPPCLDLRAHADYWPPVAAAAATAAAAAAAVAAGATVATMAPKAAAAAAVAAAAAIEAALHGAWAAADDAFRPLVHQSECAEATLLLLLPWLLGGVWTRLVPCGSLEPPHHRLSAD